MDSCKRFSKIINCDLNTTVQKCEEMKVSLMKHCKNKECEGTNTIKHLMLALTGTLFLFRKCAYEMNFLISQKKNSSSCKTELDGVIGYYNQG